VILFLLLASATALEHGQRDEKRVAITFDLCSAGKYLFDEDVYASVERLRVPATIFIGGVWAEKNPALARRIAADPLLEVASHSYHHPHLTELNASELDEEFAKSQQAIFKVTGVWPHLLRAPYGEIDAHVLDAAARHGLTIVQYDLPSGDPDPALKADKIVRWVVDSAKGGSVIVMHINQNGVHTAETFPRIVHELRRKGFELVTVSQLLGEPNTFTNGAACSM
jgi:peptidoglycan/xylan/chitin deacetylase (PgdA/CDA1 family)